MSKKQKDGNDWVPILKNGNDLRAVMTQLYIIYIYELNINF